jgi:hypothetical protein
LHILPTTAWREFRGRPKQGQNMTTHLAVVQAPNGRLHRCYVKMAPPNWPTPLTEAIGWLLSDALDLPRPGFAALLLVPIPKLRQSMPLDQHWHNKTEALAYCCEAVDGPGITSSWRWIAAFRARKLFKSVEARRICAFDEWVENRDRHSGNMIRRKQDGTHVPIDNEFILYSLLWSQILGVTPHSLLSEGANHLTVADHKRFQVEAANAAKAHAAALQAATPIISSTVAKVVPAPHAAQFQTAVLSFLSTRGQPDWLANQLGVIV